MTELPKKYNIGEREKYWQDFWAKEDVFKFDEESNKPVYSVDTPPPYVSADHLHTGHIMSYSQAEFVVRYKRMRGFNVYYPMGFDDNGLPTERYVEKKYKIDKSKTTRPEFVKICLEETKKGAQNYKDLWTSLGISVDWSKTYSTINKHCQRISQWSFIDLYKQGKMLHKEEPTFWCPKCQTALAQADLDDKEEKGKLNYVNFSSSDGQKLQIATTRPELIPACVALFVNPDDKRYKDLIGKKAKIPLFDYEVPIMADELVDPEFGTGLMMVCTWGDAEDVRKWKEHKLEARKIVDTKGLLTELAGPYKGLYLTKAREQIIADLKKEGLLEKQEDAKHVMNVHERCDTPAEFIITKQWFISVLEAKEALLKRGEELKWYPDHMKSRYVDWVEALKWDWCISRDRYYGVPFPVWHCQDCAEVILPAEKDLPVDPSVDKPPVDACPKCKSKNIVPESNVMDTWMTSSLTPLIGARLVEDEKMQQKLYPATLRPQAFEIIRTWLFYTVTKSHYHHKSLPFSDAMISGHGLDDKGRKISKSLGNYIDADKIIEQYGADAIRYWATGASLGANMRYSEEEIKKGKRTVNKLWNATKFCLSHFEDLDLEKKVELEPADQWVLDELYHTIENVTQDFDNYEYSKARNSTDAFFWQTFTDNYLEFIKYRLYNREEVGEESFVAAQQTLYACISAILKLYAPIMPFITEELYQAYFKGIEGTASIHISTWPEAKGEWEMNKKLKSEFSHALDVINDIRKFKSDNQISLGKEIAEFKIKNKDLSDEYFTFIEKATRVKKLIK